MKMENKKTFKCNNCEEQHPIEKKKDWGFRYVCPACEDYLFDRAEVNHKRTIKL